MAVSISKLRVSVFALGALALSPLGCTDEPAPVVGASKNLSELATIKPDDVDVLPAASRAALSPVQRRTIAATRLPVLLPPAPRLLQRAILTTGGDWYAASIPVDGVTVLVSGTRQMVHNERIERLDRREEGLEHFRLSRVHGIVETEFLAFGAAYSVSVECSRADDDRCRSDDYIRDLTLSLGLAEDRPWGRSTAGGAR